MKWAARRKDPTYQAKVDKYAALFDAERADQKLAIPPAAATFADMARQPERALYGTIEDKLLLRLTHEQNTAAREAAEEAGVTVSEWWRRAGWAALAQQKRAAKRRTPNKAR